MNNLLKLGVYVAAGVGTYELLRRAGLIEKASAWLEEQIPQDLKDRAYELQNRARAQAEDLANQATDAVRRTTGYAPPVSEESDTARPASVGNGHGGPTITGNGQGIPVTTDDFDGLHVSHKVGRGVVR